MMSFPAAVLGAVTFQLIRTVHPTFVLTLILSKEILLHTPLIGP